MRPIPPTPSSEIQVQDLGPQKFSLAVICDGHRFDCGTYVSRASAMQAGRLFVTRKEGERISQGKRPQKKKR